MNLLKEQNHHIRATIIAAMAAAAILAAALLVAPPTEYVRAHGTCANLNGEPHPEVTVTPYTGHDGDGDGIGCEGNPRPETTPLPDSSPDPSPAAIILLTGTAAGIIAMAALGWVLYRPLRQLLSPTPTTTGEPARVYRPPPMHPNPAGKPGDARPAPSTGANRPKWSVCSQCGGGCHPNFDTCLKCKTAAGTAPAQSKRETANVCLDCGIRCHPNSVRCQSCAVQTFAT